MTARPPGLGEARRVASRPHGSSAARVGLAWLAAVLAIALTTRLGFWQLDRAAQKQAVRTQIDARAALPPLAPVELARDAAAATDQWQRRTALRGQGVAKGTVFLDNRPLDGAPGFLVFTPLVLDEAAGDAVLVQRGWAPRHREDRNLLPPVQTPSGRVDVQGHVAPPPSVRIALGLEGSGVIRQNLDLAAHGAALGLALRPWLLVQEGATSEGLRRDRPAAALDVGKHHAYAAQWFALAALILGLAIWFGGLREGLRRRAARVSPDPR